MEKMLYGITLRTVDAETGAMTAIDERTVATFTRSEGQRLAKGLALVAQPAYKDEVVATVTVAPVDGQYIHAAAAIVRTVLARCETRQPFFRLARVTIDGVLAVCRDSGRAMCMADLDNVTDVGQELIGIALEALAPVKDEHGEPASRYIRYGRNGVEERACVPLGDFPVLAARNAAYDAVQSYLDHRRGEDERMVWSDIAGAVKWDDDRLDAEFAADYAAAYRAGTGPDSPAINMRWDDDRRAEYMADRRKKTTIVRTCLAVMTERQRTVMVLRSKGFSFRAIARKMHLKDVKSVTAHFTAGRKAVGRKTDIGEYDLGVTPFEPKWNDGEHWTNHEMDAIEAHDAYVALIRNGGAEWMDTGRATDTDLDEALRRANSGPAECGPFTCMVGEYAYESPEAKAQAKARHDARPEVVAERKRRADEAAALRKERLEDAELMRLARRFYESTTAARRARVARIMAKGLDTRVVVDLQTAVAERNRNDEWFAWHRALGVMDVRRRVEAYNRGELRLA